MHESQRGIPNTTIQCSRHLRDVATLKALHDVTSCADMVIFAMSIDISIRPQKGKCPTEVLFTGRVSICTISQRPRRVVAAVGGILMRERTGETQSCHAILVTPCSLAYDWSGSLLACTSVVAKMEGKTSCIPVTQREVRPIIGSLSLPAHSVYGVEKFRDRSWLSGYHMS